jgi:hypothetical protein
LFYLVFLEVAKIERDQLSFSPDELNISHCSGELCFVTINGSFCDKYSSKIQLFSIYDFSKLNRCQWERKSNSDNIDSIHGKKFDGDNYNNANNYSWFSLNPASSINLIHSIKMQRFLQSVKFPDNDKYYDFFLSFNYNYIDFCNKFLDISSVNKSESGIFLSIVKPKCVKIREYLSRSEINIVAKLRKIHLDGFIELQTSSFLSLVLYLSHFKIPQSNKVNIFDAKIGDVDFSDYSRRQK